MTRQVSGTYERTDRVRVPSGTDVRLRIGGRSVDQAATVLELSLLDLLLSSSVPPPNDSVVTLTIALRDRFIEFEISGVVVWQRGTEFSVALDHLSARQTYGLALAIDLAQKARDATLIAAGSARR